MYRIHGEITFESAHFLPKHLKCGKLHGHTYRVEVWIVGRELREPIEVEEGRFEGEPCMLLDFKRVKWLLQKIKEKFDHKLLNDVCDFVPTAENLSRYIYYYLQKVLQTKYHTKNVRIERVRVWEGRKNYCEYYESE